MQKNNPFDTEVEEYEEWFKINNNILESELEAIRQVLPASGRGTEIGVGTGIFASRLGIGHGVEPSKRMAAEAIKKGIHVIAARAEALPLDDHSFWFVLMVTADCFLDDVPKAFLEVRRIIESGGFFIIAFLDRDTPLGRLYEQNKHLHKSYRDANFHSAKEISELLEEAGFELQDKKQTVYSLDNKMQEVRSGSGEGLFAVIKAKKIG